MCGVWPGGRVTVELARAQRLASELLGDLLDVCERIEVAGSVRRRRDNVKDIELVLIPKWGRQTISGQASLLGDNTEQVNLARERILDLERGLRLRVIKPGTRELVPWHIAPDGRYWRLALPTERDLQPLRVDVFVCDERTWGLNLMIRTGSGVGEDGRPESGFAPAMLSRWKVISGGRSEGAMLRDKHGGIVETPEERDVFDAIRVRWVEPEMRRTSRDVEAAALIRVVK